ncbi:MAG: hypothetical protein AAFU41_00680 [Pseudomonadota bacterium]
MKQAPNGYTDHARRATDLGFSSLEHLMTAVENAVPRYFQEGGSWTMELTVALRHVYPPDEDRNKVVGESYMSANLPVFSSNGGQS